MHPRILEHDDVMNWKQEDNGTENFISYYEGNIREGDNQWRLVTLYKTGPHVIKHANESMSCTLSKIAYCI